MSAGKVVDSILENISKVMVGKEKTVELLLAALISGGHVLIEDVPGVGKTVLAKTLARTLKLDYRRIQFTPDLIPSDILGLNYYNQKEGEFRFREGPIMANIVLADEVNRATPRTQAALLEAMGEGQVTIDGATYRLPQPFMVIATQNPVEFEGTFPLPEAQLDRFLMRLEIGYPDSAQEIEILGRFGTGDPLNGVEGVAGIPELEDLKKDSEVVYVCRDISGYIVKLVHATRQHSTIRLGCSPRASLALYRTSKALAFLRGRDFVIPDDVQELAGPVIAHRMVLEESALLRGERAEDIIGMILHEVEIPIENEKGWRCP